MGFYILTFILVVIVVLLVICAVRNESRDIIVMPCMVNAVIISICAVMLACFCIDSSSTHIKYNNFIKEYNNALILSKAKGLSVEQQIFVANKVLKVNDRILDELNACNKNEFWFGRFKNYEIAALDFIDYEFE